MTKSPARAGDLELLGTCAFARVTEPKTGAVQGTVFTPDADGGRSVYGQFPTHAQSDFENSPVFADLVDTCRRSSLFRRDGGKLLWFPRSISPDVGT